MNEHNPHQPLSRRGFFRRIATLAGAAAAGVVAVARPRTESQPAGPEIAPVEKPGYRVTEHVRKYYQKARTV